MENGHNTRFVLLLLLLLLLAKAASAALIVNVFSHCSCSDISENMTIGTVGQGRRNRGTGSATAPQTLYVIPQALLLRAWEP